MATCSKYKRKNDEGEVEEFEEIDEEIIEKKEDGTNEKKIVKTAGSWR